MAAPSPGYSIIIRVDAPAGYRVTSQIAEAVGEAGAQVTALDVAESLHDRRPGTTTWASSPGPGIGINEGG